MRTEDYRSHFRNLITNKQRADSDKEWVDNVLKSHLMRIPQKKLYKFRSCTDRNIRILEENCIWMPLASSFVDTFDCTLNIDIPAQRSQIKKWIERNKAMFLFILINELCVKQGRKCPLTIADFENYNRSCVTSKGNINLVKERAFFRKVAPRFGVEYQNKLVENLQKIRQDFLSETENELFLYIQGLTQTIDDVRFATKKKLHVYCLSETIDNAKQWEAYADDYRGFCIEYSFDNTRLTNFDDYKQLIYLLPVIYRTKIPTMDIIPLFDAAIKKYVFDVYNEDEYIDSLIDVNMQCYYKGKDYASEKEWRLCIYDKPDCKQYFPFVNAIYCGKDIKKHNLARLINVAKKLGVPIYIQSTKPLSNKYHYTLIEK